MFRRSPKAVAEVGIAIAGASVCEKFADLTGGLRRDGVGAIVRRRLRIMDGVLLTIVAVHRPVGIKIDWEESQPLSLAAANAPFPDRQSSRKSFPTLVVRKWL